MTEPLKDVFFQDWDSLAAAGQRLREEGWEVLPLDAPERGVRGVVGRRAGDEPVWLKWLPFRRELEARVRVCSTWEEFLAELELRKDDDMEKCDDVPAGQVGFATYGRAEAHGVCEVVRLPLGELQRGGPEARQRLIALLRTFKHPGAEAMRRLSSG